MSSEQPSERLKTSIASFYNDPLFSDIILQLGESQEFHGHKIILSVKSGFFRKAFTGSFKEASESRMTLFEDDAPHIIIALLRHLYDLPYTTYPESPFQKTSNKLLFNAQGFVVADKYDVPSLMSRVIEDTIALIKEKLDDDPTDICETISFLYKYENMANKSFFAVIEASCLVKLEQYLAVPAFVDLLKSTPPLAIALLDELPKLNRPLSSLAPGVHKVYLCPSCHNCHASNTVPHCPSCYPVGRITMLSKSTWLVRKLHVD
ncbi:hypothetical protein AAFC00_002298 [Neodothiora populina]|uniref:BTB domain-containing protein n=1 Tax=Neodothiora populina TaxID=2781224 RepID=A0ABR3PGZ9_9PEZI